MQGSTKSSVRTVTPQLPVQRGHDADGGLPDLPPGGKWDRPAERSTARATQPQIAMSSKTAITATVSVSSMRAIVLAPQHLVEGRSYEYVTMNMKTKRIAAAARQRPIRRSSRAVMSRCAMASPAFRRIIILRTGVSKITQSKEFALEPVSASSENARRGARRSRGATL
jgi:hypothetical protein